MESVRPAGPGDRRRCAELLAAARDQGLDQRGGELLDMYGLDGPGPPGPLDDTEASVLSWIAGDPDRRLLLGLYDGAAVGIAAGRVATSLRGDDLRLGQIALCYVEPDARQVGVGSALVAELTSWFRSRDCTHVDGVALPGDRDTKQLYERAGFKARLLILNRPLG
ncbi:MAG: GNAT family N-acetyltransferase [Acidimicrobiales bacterium]